MMVVAALVTAAAMRVVASRGIATMNALLVAGQQGAVLGHREPPRPYRAMANHVRATSALLTGQYALTLRLLGAPPPPACRPSWRREPDVARQRADRPGSLRGGGGRAGQGPGRRHPQAPAGQAAIETGEDQVAVAPACSPPHTWTPWRRRGMRRILGDLHIRRLRLDQGEALVREAQRLYLASGVAACEVDAGCWVPHAGQASMHRGDAAQALRQFGSARRMLTVRPDNAAGIAMVELALAEAHALTGDPRAAESALTHARDHAVTMASPAFAAAVECSTGMVAVHLGRADARTHLLTARAMHDALGELPQVSTIDELLRTL